MVVNSANSQRVEVNAPTARYIFNFEGLHGAEGDVVVSKYTARGTIDLLFISIYNNILRVQPCSESSHPSGVHNAISVTEMAEVLTIIQVESFARGKVLVFN